MPLWNYALYTRDGLYGNVSVWKMESINKIIANLFLKGGNDVTVQ